MKSYDDVQSRLARGWNTWNTYSVLSQVRLPDGLAVNVGLKEYYRGTHLANAQIGRRGDMDERVTMGPHALDGSFTEVTVLWAGIEILVQSAHVGDDLVVLVTPRRNQAVPATLTVTVGHLWGRRGVVELQGDEIHVTGPGPDKLHADGTAVADPHLDITGPHLTLRLDRPVALSTGEPRVLGQIQEIISDARKALTRSSDPGVGEHHAIVRDAIAWNTIYEPAGERVITTVSRLWNIEKRGGFAMFCWDTFFNALLAGVNNRDLAYANAVEMIRELTPAGFVPNVVQGTGRSTYDGSQPPIGSFVCWQLYQSFGDRWFLEEVFDSLLSWNRWWWSTRRQGTMLCPGSTWFEPEFPSPQDIPRIHQHFGATCETGADDHPAFAEIPFSEECSMLMAHDIGLNCEYALDCEALADIAAVLGRTEQHELRDRGRTVTRAVHSSLWDAEAEVYRSRRTDTGRFVNALSPMSFFALALDDLPSASSKMVKRYLDNTDQFGGKWVIPSTPHTDPDFGQQSYWSNGRVWPPVNFLVYIALLRSGHDTSREWLAQRSADLVLKEWGTDRHVHENYSGESGMGCDQPNSEPFHSWGALLSLIQLMEHRSCEYFSDWRHDH